jgi:hypothetical protein
MTQKTQWLRLRIEWILEMLIYCLVVAAGMYVVYMLLSNVLEI